jgi:(p)ppGpp synthase/HD superfamily hydrolase
VFCAKSVESLENKRVEFLVSTKRRKRVRKSLKRKNLSLAASDERRVAERRRAISVLLAVYPLKEDVKQTATPKNAKTQEDGKRHIGLTRTDANASHGQGNRKSEDARKS